MTAVEECVNGKDPDFFSSGLMALEHRLSVYHTRGQLHRKRRGGSQPETRAGVCKTLCPQLPDSLTLFDSNTA